MSTDGKSGLAVGESVVWRVGSKVPLNVYENNRPVCQCHFEHDAVKIVDALNSNNVIAELKADLSKLTNELVEQKRLLANERARHSETSALDSLHTAENQKLRAEYGFTSMYAQLSAEQLVEAIRQEARNELLRIVLASIAAYPNPGGDVQVMAALDTLFSFFKAKVVDLETQLAAVDNALARRSALDGIPTRSLKIEHAINIAKHADVLTLQAAMFNKAAESVIEWWKKKGMVMCHPSMPACITDIQNAIAFYGDTVVCIRKNGHSGPCNGIPRVECFEAILKTE